MADFLKNYFSKEEEEPSALQLIEREKKERTGGVNLSGKELTEIPKEILKLTHLQILDLSKNRLVDISLLANLTNLQSLVLNSNRIVDIRLLANIANLQSLDLR